ncbi:cytochrome b-561 domain containing 1 [Nannochloropsis gaditana]|uniref:Cytochrome b-561 domain containing 1 n=1 Tax=Nannochloropsis gaditana TaxID=72520 RepID=W7TJN5_9STRA|nr:cytochrome b-561 domain containing 1 [Nannochloropsis gaditana]
MMQAPQNCVHVSILAVCSLYRTLPRLTYPLFTNFTDAVTELRRNFVARLKILDPLVESNLIIHLFAISLLLWIWGISLARAHTLTLFSFHPVFMSMGCVLFMTEGILAYRNHACFQFLSPIMRNSARVKLQNIHRGFHILAAVCVVMGMAFIFSNKVKKHRTILPTSIHAALGFLVCALMVLQMIAGLEKLDAQRSGVIGGNGRDGGGVLYRWHGKAGLILYDVAMATVATGLVKSLGFGLITFLMVLHVCLVWFMVHLQMGSKPFRPTEDGGLTDRELIELRREGGCDGGDEKGEKGRGSKGNFVPRKDSGDFTDPI